MRISFRVDSSACQALVAILAAKKLDVFNEERIFLELGIPNDAPVVEYG